MKYSFLKTICSGTARTDSGVSPPGAQRSTHAISLSCTLKFNFKLSLKIKDFTFLVGAHTLLRSAQPFS